MSPRSLLLISGAAGLMGMLGWLGIVSGSGERSRGGMAPASSVEGARAASARHPGLREGGVRPTRVSPEEKGGDAFARDAAEWVAADPGGALAWLVAGRAGGTFFFAVAGELLREFPAEVAGALAGLSPSAERDDLLARSASEWAAASLGEAADWALSLPAGDLREKVMVAVAVAGAGADPELALGLIERECPADERQASAVVSIALQWPEEKSGELLEVVENLPGDGLRESVAQHLVDAWAARDAGKLEAWLETLPPGGFGDRAVAHYAQILARRDPARAAEWAATIAPFSALRGQSIRVALVEWVDADPVAASAWMERKGVDFPDGAFGNGGNQ